MKVVENAAYDNVHKNKIKDSLIKYKNIKDHVIQLSEKTENQSKIELYANLKENIIVENKLNDSMKSKVDFVKKIFKVKTKKNKSFIDNIFYDGISKSEIELLLVDLNKILNLINFDYIKNVEKISIFLTQKDDNKAFSVGEQNAIIVEFSEYNHEFILLQIMHEFIHFIEIYNPNLNLSNINYIKSNMKGVKSSDLTKYNKSKGFLYDIGTIDEYSGFVYDDLKTELLSNELMFFFQNPIDSLVLNNKFFIYLTDIEFFK